MKKSRDKLSKSDIRAIILFVLCVIVIGVLITWLIIEAVPYLIFAIAFIPWLLQALNDGGKV